MKDLTRELGRNLAKSQARDLQGGQLGPFIWGKAETKIGNDVIFHYSFLIITWFGTLGFSWQQIK